MNSKRQATPSARTRILATAADLFYHQGIRAVGVDAIIARSGVAKMTFYHHFKSKDALVAAYLQRTDERWLRWLRVAVARYAGPPRERPLALFDGLEAFVSRDDFRGCTFINAIAEIAQPAHPAYAVAVAGKQHIQALVTELLLAADFTDSEVLTRQFMVLIDGAIVTALRERRAEAVRIARDIAALLLHRAIA